jgi:hypothetical protein
MLNFFVTHPTYLNAALAKRRSERDKKNVRRSRLFLFAFRPHSISSRFVTQHSYR